MTHCFVIKQSRYIRFTILHGITKHHIAIANKKIFCEILALFIIKLGHCGSLWTMISRKKKMNSQTVKVHYAKQGLHKNNNKQINSLRLRSRFRFGTKSVSDRAVWLSSHCNSGMQFNVMRMVIVVGISGLYAPVNKNRVNGQVMEWGM